MTEYKYKVGDKVFVDISQYSRILGYEGQVVKVTPSGLFDVKAPLGSICRFNKYGEVTGHYGFYKPIIVDGERKAEIIREIQLAKIDRWIDNQCDVITCSKRDVDAMRKAHGIIGRKIELMQQLLEGDGE